MIIDPNDAAQSLDDIKRIEQRTREALYYAGASGIFILWGVLSILSYLTPMIFPWLPWYRGFSGIAVAVVGMAGTFWITYRRSRAAQRRRDWRIYYALLILTGYGLVFLFIFAPAGSRQASAFWPLIYMLGYALAGLWVGRFFLLCGFTVTAFILIGYLWSGAWFPLWMAASIGGGLIASGLWLRQTAR